MQSKPCEHCGDPGSKTHAGKTCCPECYAELALGEIGPPPKPTLKPGNAGELEDTGPWQSNAIRDMEDRQ